MPPNSFPPYNDNLKMFLAQLREHLALTLEQVAAVTGRHHTTIARYESYHGDNQIKAIPLHYVITLANLYMERLLSEAEQPLFLAEINHAIQHYYKGKVQPFPDVATLRQAAVNLPTDKPSPAPTTAWPAPPAVDSARTRHRFDSYLSLHDLFGVAEAQARLLAALQNAQDRWLVLIDGTGGIGKTTLASQLASLCQPDFYDVLWLSAKQEKFDIGRGVETLNQPVLSAAMLVDELLTQLDPTFELGRPPDEKLTLLAHWFHQKPYLVVIDNLETMADNNALLPILQHLIRPTKFLLTTRWHEAQDVFYESLTEWSEAEAVAFLRYWGRTQAMPTLVEASAADLSQIYQVVGGNPLALKLVAGRLKTHTLAKVLAELRLGASQKMNEFYTYLYHLAWQDLAEMSQKLLLQLLYLREYEDLARKFETETLDAALTQLHARSLIEVRGAGLDERSYHLHRLTETFLQTNIIKRQQWA